MGKRESKFQGDLINELQEKFPGCLVLKNDPNYIQGIPDLSVFYKNKWAMLECKKNEKERKDPEPNQEYYISEIDKMSFARFIYPENKEEVLNELARTFKPNRSTRNSKSK